MGKLHQLLAVVQDKKSAASKIFQETAKIFQSKHQLFEEEQKDFRPVSEEDRLNNLRAGELSTGHKMGETVASKMAHLAEHFGPWVDAAFQVDSTNLEATAELDIDGSKFKMPATFLLQLEKILRDLRGLYDTIPTLDMKVDWKLDPDKGNGIWQAPKQETVKTKKIAEHKVIVPATDHHPAQVAEYIEDVPVGVFEIHRWSGKITPEQKYKILKRVDGLIEKVKVARGKANEAEHSENHIAEVLFGFLHKDLEA